MKTLASTILVISGIALHTSALSQPVGTTIQVSFPRGSSSVKLKGTVKAGYIDYSVKAGAGQMLSVSLKGSNLQNYMNILAPNAGDAAMFMGSTSGNTFKGALPDDGTYRVRVYMMRAAARRGESSRFSLSISLTGKAMAPIGGGDALVQGTRFHAQADVPLKWDLEPKIESCKASVVRRSRDGSATLVLIWGSHRRTVLFVKGKPVVTDSPEKLSWTRSGDVTKVNVGNQESFNVPDALIFGG